MIKNVETSPVILLTTKQPSAYLDISVIFTISAHIKLK